MSIGILPSVKSISLNRDVNSAQNACSLTGRLKSHRTKSRKKGDDKSAAAVVKSVRQLSCVSQDTEPPESTAISSKDTKVLRPIRRVRFTRAALRQANIRENKGASLGKNTSLNSSSAQSSRFEKENRSPGETPETRAMRPRRRVETCQENLQAQKKEDKATFHSPSEEWIMPAASTLKPGEREFVVDSGASMHVVSKKDLNKAELETVRISKNPTTVVTANGEVLTKEEATVYV